MYPQNNVSSPGDEIVFSQEQLQKIGFALLGLVVLLSIIGYFASPRDGDDTPILLSPEVKAVEDYRRSAKDWMEQLEALDGEIAGVLATENQGDLFIQSRQAQQMLQHAVDLAQQVDQRETPAAVLGFHEQMVTASLAYLEAARAALRWVSAPEPARKENARAKQNLAQTSLQILQGNTWMQTR